MFVKQTWFGRIISQLLILLAIGICALPLVFIVLESIKGQGPANYRIVVESTPFLTFLRNSALISVITVAVVLVTAICAAYGVALLRPRGAGLIQVLILAGLTMPVIALVVPVYTVVQELGLFDTYWAVIIPLTAISIPFGVLVGSNYIRSIPIEVYEAAKLDGAGPFRFLIHILIPICRPIIAVIAIFTFLAAWNEYLLPLLFLQDVDLKTVTQVPTYFQSQRLVDTPKIFAANVLISLPIIAVYLALQGTFRRGLASGAVK